MRRLVWAVLLISPAATPYATAQGRFEAIDERLDGIEKQLKTLRDLERDSKTTKRQFVELEDDIRKLRSQMDFLEQRMKTTQASIDALRGEIARLGGRVAVAESEKPRAGTSDTKQAATPAEVPPVTIRGQQLVAEGDFLTITGAVANTSEQALTFVVVEATFLDARNSVVKTESGYTNPRVIGPGATATFRIVTRRDTRIRNHRLKVRTE